MTADSKAAARCSWCRDEIATHISGARFFSSDEEPLCVHCWSSEYGSDFATKSGLRIDRVDDWLPIRASKDVANG